MNTERCLEEIMNNKIHKLESLVWRAYLQLCERQTKQAMIRHFKLLVSLEQLSGGL